MLNLLAGLIVLLGLTGFIVRLVLQKMDLEKKIAELQEQHTKTKSLVSELEARQKNLVDLKNLPESLAEILLEKITDYYSTTASYEGLKLIENHKAFASGVIAEDEYLAKYSSTLNDLTFDQYDRQKVVKFEDSVIASATGPYAVKVLPMITKKIAERG